MTRTRLHYGEPLLAGAARRPTGVLLACCAVVVAALGMLFAHQTMADRLDQVIDGPVIT